MQHILNEEEYQEYLRLKKHNTEAYVHQVVLEQEREVERLVNKFHDEHSLGELIEPFNYLVMVDVFNLMRMKVDK